MEQSEYLLEMLDITKEFPGVKALKGVTLKVKPHEIHALVGENGAGKSTISKCLMGIYTPTSGKVIFDGVERSNYTIKEAMAFGISMIHQELSPVPDRTVMSNMYLGREPRTKLGIIDWKKMYDDSKKWLKEVELNVDPKTRMADLSVAQMQMVEIARAISSNAKLIIMDEPTSALTEREVDQLFKVMRKLRNEGRSMVYISHKLDEIYKITDKISVFRDGEYIGTEDSDKLPLNRMIQMMVGREVNDLFPKVRCKIGEPFMEVENLSHSKYFNNVSFNVRRGEIFGIAGLVGAGRTEVIETIFGIRDKSNGSVKLAGKEVEIKSSRDAIRHGMALLTEERRKDGIFPILDIKFNTTVANIGEYINKLGLIDKKQIKKDTDNYIRLIGVKTPSSDQLIQFLSGGNQQKVLIARWLLTNREIIFLDEPTRGIDVGAKAEIHKLIGELASQGKCVVMISSELPEILGMSDRIMVMKEGEVTGILENSKDLSQEILMEYASGVRNDYQNKKTALEDK